MDLVLPVRVSGFEPDGSSWEEITTTDDLSLGGAGFLLRHRVELGQVLQLALNMPRRLRQHDFNEPSYRIYVLVRGLQHQRDGATRVGAMFFGKHPPRGYHERPAARFLLPSDTQTGMPAGMVKSEWPQPPPTQELPTPPPLRSPEGLHPPGAHRTEELPAPGAPWAPAEAVVSEAPGGKERRRSPRVNVFVNFTLQQVDEWGAVLQEELTVADNVSKGGARVMTALGFHKGDLVMIQEAGGGFAARAEVREVYRGADRIGRLHLKFLDREAPDRILRS